jgi:hypothetical protein
MLTLFINQSPHTDKANCMLRLVVADVKAWPAHIFVQIMPKPPSQADLSVCETMLHIAVQVSGTRVESITVCIHRGACSTARTLSFDEALRLAIMKEYLKSLHSAISRDLVGPT